MNDTTMTVPVPVTEEAPALIVTEEVLARAFSDIRDELLSTLWFLLGNREDAADMAQEAFYRCWRTREGLTEIRNLRAWIFRISLNAARDLQRSAWRRRVRSFGGEEDMLIDNATPHEQELEDQELLGRIRQAVHTLRPEEQEVFLLRQNANLSYEQIAEVAHRPIGTVKTQMRAALQKLRQVMA